MVLQAHAASAVLNFSESCTPDVLTPYLDGIVSKLRFLLQVHLSLKFIIISRYGIYNSWIQLIKKYFITFSSMSINGNIWKKKKSPIWIAVSTEFMNNLIALEHLFWWYIWFVILFWKLIVEWKANGTGRCFDSFGIGCWFISG